MSAVLTSFCPASFSGTGDSAHPANMHMWPMHMVGQQSQPVRVCIDPAVSAQVRPLMQMPQREFSSSAPGGDADGYRS